MTVTINGSTGIVGATWTTAGRPSSPAVGQRGFNTTINGAEIYNGDQWNPMSNGFSATGGTKTRVGGYTIHTFLSSGTFTPDFAGEVEYLVVAGGGGGGLDGYGAGRGGGGGGAGGLLTATNFAVAATGLTVTIGAGGAGTSTASSPVGATGANSVFSSITASGGGGGGGHSASGQIKSGNGASSGGGTNDLTLALGVGSAISGQGHQGGLGLTGTPYQGGGGGGSSVVGTNASGTVGGAGGAGTYSNYSGSIVPYAGGGGGGCRNASVGGIGGAGGGGAGGLTSATAGTANTGGGGGGCSGTSAAGGSGIVIIRYPTAGQITLVNGDPVGKVLQVLQSTLTASFTTTSTTFVDLLTLAITPSATTSKIFVSYTTNGGTNGDATHIYTQIHRNSTDVLTADSAGNRSSGLSLMNTAAQQTMSYTGCFLDSPSTTSAITYKLKVRTASDTAYINRSARDTNLAGYDGRAVTTLTAWEIGV